VYNLQYSPCCTLEIFSVRVIPRLRTSLSTGEDAMLSLKAAGSSCEFRSISGDADHQSD